MKNARDLARKQGVPPTHVEIHDARYLGGSPIPPRVLNIILMTHPEWLGIREPGDNPVMEQDDGCGTDTSYFRL